MRKGQQQIRCSSGVSIAGRIDSRLQVIRLFIPVLSSPIPNPLSLTKSLHVILHSSSHGRLKLCPNPNRGVFSPQLHTVKARIKNKKTVVDVLSFWFQIQGLPPQKTRGPTGQHLGQVPEMVRSGGDVVVHPPHGGDTGMSLQGQAFYLNDLTSCWTKIQVDRVLHCSYEFSFVFDLRKRRSPSPGRRRRSPSPPRRRRSPSPRRRYMHISVVIICK